MHYALQWGLYGKEGLPEKDVYDIWPFNAKPEHVKVSIDYEVIEQKMFQGEVIKSIVRYRIVRKTSSRRPRATDEVNLYEIKDYGMEPVDEKRSSADTVKMIVGQQLPATLREVFFTDGDRALSFIEGKSTPRKNVENAIRSLLGVNIIDETLSNVKKYYSKTKKARPAISEFGKHTYIEDSDNAKIRRDQLSNECSKIRDKLIKIEKDLADTTSLIRDALPAREYKQKLDSIDNEITELKLYKVEIDRKHPYLFKNKNISRDLLQERLSSVFVKLQGLYDSGKMPTKTAPILEDILSKGTCICGESLVEFESGGRKRRQHVEQLIYDSRNMDKIQEIVTLLYFEIKNFISNDNLLNWHLEYKDVGAKRLHVEKELGLARIAKTKLGEKIDSIGSNVITELRETEARLLDEQINAKSNLMYYEKMLEDANEHYLKCEKKLKDWYKRRKIEDRNELMYRTMSEIKKILEETRSQLLKDELDKTSKLMNKIFLKMILVDPKSASTIKKAEINTNFEIVVISNENKKLNLSTDLNGASRRALTLSFILALVGVSEVDAPNVIDTPLGMTSGHIRTSILKTTIERSSQLILFLTHAEILECEEIIDKNAGVQVTLTNTAHYPKILVNDPNKKRQQFLICKCNHREKCKICERHSNKIVPSSLMEK